MARTFAAASIGGNTVHLLVAASDGELITRIDNLSEWTALGEVVARSGLISNERVEQLVYVMREIRRVAQARKAESLYCFAPEAIRSARNFQPVIQHLQSQAGVCVEVIPLRREMELAVEGSLVDTRADEPTVFIEIGGSNAQIAQIENEKITRHVPLAIGTGRVTAEAGLKHPCPQECLREATRYVDSAIEMMTLSAHGAKAVLSGGVGRGLWRALHPDGEKHLYRFELDYMISTTARLTADRIVARFGVKPKRATVQLPGSLVLRGIMDKIGLHEIAISEFGIREGAILKMARGEIEGTALAAS